MRTIEDIITVTVDRLTTSAIGFETLAPGKIIGVVAYRIGELNNPGFVRAAILDNANAEVSKFQHIDNYRSREGEYLKACKPLDIQGGKKYTVKVQATEEFAEETSFEFIFIYEDTEKGCQNTNY